MAGPISPIQSLIRPDLRGRVTEVWDTVYAKETFIADRVCPLLDVDFASGTFIRIPREAWTKDPADMNRGADGDYKEIEYKTDTLQYQTVEQGLAVRVDHNLANQAKTYFDAEVVAAKQAISHAHRIHEKAIAALVMNTSTFTGASLTAAATANWRTASSSATPVQDILNARQNVRQNCGFEANTVVMDWVTWQNLRETTQILGRITGGGRTPDHVASITEEAVSKVIEIPNIIVAKGIKDTADMGQTFVGSSIWPTTMCMVAYINPSADALEVTPFMAANWEGDGGSRNFTMESWVSMKRRTSYVRARRQIGPFTPYKECGFLITGCA